MTDLLNIARECGAVVMPKGTQVESVILKDAAVVLTPAELHATVEKVCKPLVRQIIDLVGEANAAGWLGEIDDMAYQSLEEDKYRSLNRTITKAIREGVNCLEDHRKLMGQDK